jgi:hypothetical protein
MACQPVSQDGIGSGSPRSMSDDAQTERVSLTNFLIRDTAECIIGILALQVNDELGKFMISTKQVYRVLWEWLETGEMAGLIWSFTQGLPSDNSREVSMRFAMGCGLNSSLKICRPSFIEPAETGLGHTHRDESEGVELTNVPN